VILDSVILPGDSGERIRRGGKLPFYAPGNIWTPHLERQVRQLRAMRGAVEAHRRRRPLGPPLCSTTFGGSTVPPLFGGGGGGFLQGDIRINSVANSELSQSAAQHTIPLASADVGDELWVQISASGLAPAEVNGDWTLAPGIGSSTSFRQYRRTADGTVADEFEMATNTLMVCARMWSIKEVIGSRQFPSSVVQGGFINSGAVDPWEVGFPPGTSLTLNTTGDPDNFVYCFANRTDRQQPTIPTPTVANSPITAMESIWAEGFFSATGGLSIDTIWQVVDFKYTAVSIAYAAYDIGYSPDVGLTGQATQHQKYRIFV